jgi:hypothetical protein
MPTLNAARDTTQHSHEQAESEHENGVAPAGQHASTIFPPHDSVVTSPSQFSPLDILQHWGAGPLEDCVHSAQSE